MKTISQALVDEIHWSIPFGYVENTVIRRGLSGSDEYTKEVAESNEYKGALADCLYSLITAVSYSESDKSIGALTEADKKLILKMVNKLYDEIGEDTVDEGEPRVYIVD